MNSRELADYMLAQIELSYPEFLSETDLPDNPIIKVMFYGTMVAVVTEEPLKDPVAQDLLVKNLSVLHRHARVVLVKKIYGQLN